MMGWMALALLAALTAAALALLGVERRLWSTAGAALMLGAAGYAWQGRPTLAGAEPRPLSLGEEVSPAMVNLRERLMGRHTVDAAYHIAAEAMIRSGNRRAAAQVMLAAARKLPRSFIVWTGLGSALTAFADDQVSPVARLAFKRAAQLAPTHPAPPFYLGLAHARAGDLERAATLWRRALALSPEGAGYRRDIAMFIALAERDGE